MYLKVYMTDTEPLKDPAMFERLLRLVPDERRERVMSKRQTGDRAAGLAAGLLLSMATESMGLAGADEYIRYNAYGKPYYDLQRTGSSVRTDRRDCRRYISACLTRTSGRCVWCRIRSAAVMSSCCAPE